MGGADQEGTKAHVVFNDRGSVSFSMQSTTEAVTQQPCQTTITGMADSSAGPVEFTVTIRDKGEPGANRDEFSISASNGYLRENVPLGGGNIQKHHETCTGP
jgi:hypothetical protein